MKLLDKLKSIFKNKETATETPPTLPDVSHHYPVTARVMAWLDKQGWRYEHRTPDDDSDSRTHHIILSFTDNHSDWTCVFRINEYNQLVAVFGVLPDTVPPSHFTPMLMRIAYANLSIAFGSIELDPTDGEVRIKMSLDAEFSTLSDKALACYLQGVAGLTEMAQRMYDDVLGEIEPSPFLQDYLLDVPELHGETQTDGGFFMPTQTAQ